jgi:hypothetical protein
MGGELCADGPAVEEGPKLPAGRLTQTAAKWTRIPCPSGRGGKWRRTGKVDRWGALGDARRAAVCGGGGQHHVVAWAGRKAIVLRGLRIEGAARGPDGSKGFAFLRTRLRRVTTRERACAIWTTCANAGRETRASAWKWTGRCKIGLWGLRNGGVAARGLDGSKGEWVETLWAEASRSIPGVWHETGSLWEEVWSLWRRKRSEAQRVATLALFAAFVQVVTGVGYIAACFLAVLLMLPCALCALVFGAGCVHVWTLVRRTPSMAHIAAAAGTGGWCLTVGCYGQTDVSLLEDGGVVPICPLGDGEEFETGDACASGRHWCRHISGLSRKRMRTAAAETGCRRRKASAQLQSKVWDPGRFLRANVWLTYGVTHQLDSREWETMTLQQLCFPPSGLGELVDAVGAIQRTPY